MHFEPKINVNGYEIPYLKEFYSHINHGLSGKEMDLVRCFIGIVFQGYKS